MSAKDWMQKLSEASGVSGYEHSVRHLVIEAFRPYADEISVTAMGSIIALQRGVRAPSRSANQTPVPKVLVEGHMDEIGLMVTEIERGFIRFTQVGGFDVRVLPSQQVVVHGKRALPGIIGSRPPHVLSPEERQKVIPMSDLFIDVGLSEPVVRGLVQPGDLVTIARRMQSLKNNLVAGKAFDDRSAVVCVIEALRLLSTMKHACDVYAVANVQEEFGVFAGAATSTFAINPDIAIAVDVSHADQPDTSEVNAVPLDEGMGIATGPNIHPLVHARLVEIAEAREIPYRVTAYAGATGTNAWAMQVVRAGIPTGLIDIPLRYMHTSVETLALGDLERIGRLLADFCVSLDDQFLRELKGERNGGVEKPKARAKTRAGRAHTGRGTRKK
ncbi:MAG: M42 family metallopeptidase [Chloroflexi bacterium]|nr:M42 family metallopeptidase [Chloroflexota bacterium]